MNYEQKFEQNKQRQIDLIKNKKPFHSKKIYDGQIDKLVDKVYGFRKSYENSMSIDGDDNPIPWMTYPFISYLSQLDLSQCDVFEWGSGNSTLYFAKKAKTVTSIESNSEWYDYVKSSKPENAELNLVDMENYAKIIKIKNKKYNIISIDGDIFRRFECAYYAVDFLKEGGMIILDNSDWLENTTSFLRSRDLIQIDFAGLVPIKDFISCTSIFLRRDFNLRSNGKKQPGFLKGGIRNERD